MIYVTTSFYEHKSLSETLWTRYKAESCLSAAHMQEKLHNSEMQKSIKKINVTDMILKLWPSDSLDRD